MKPLFVVTVLCLVPATLWAVDADKATYTGGTLTGIQAKSEGAFSTDSPTAASFTVKKSPPLTIPYARITALEYGQKAGRRVAVAGFISPLALFSKKRNHYLTITFTDDAGTEQAAVFELGKDIVRTTLKVLEVRSKRAVEYQDDEARKSVGGGQTP